MKSLRNRLLASCMALLATVSCISVSAAAQGADAAQSSVLPASQNAVSAVLADNTAQWPNFRGSDDNIARTDAKTARSAGEAKLNWTLELKASTDWSTAISDPVMVNDQLYYAVGSRLFVVDKSGSIVKKTDLDGTIDYTCRPLYLDGKVVIPLDDGSLQALDASTLETVWTADTPAEWAPEGDPWRHQPLTTLTSQDGYIYAGTACADWSSSYYGVYRCIDGDTGAVVWVHENQNAGYYWSGAAHLNGAVIVAGDDGNLISLDAKTGDERASLALGEKVRTTVVRNGDEVLMVSVDGTLHKVKVLEDGTFGAHTQVNFSAYSTSTPAVHNGMAYVGGQKADYSGVFSIIDLSTMQIVQTAAAPADIKSAPLLSTGHAGEVYAYFTSNANPGALYAVKYGSDEAEARVVFTPSGDDQNYCMASVIADENGTLYYTNDSGKLFAVGYNGGDNSSDTSSDVSSESSVSEGTSQGGSSELPSSSISSASNSNSDGQSSSNPASSVHSAGTPATGDHSVSMVLLIVLVAAAVIAVVLLVVLRSKSKKK
ncbi:PQQ-binding-like beta-propeller repeat protein [Candidatus Soleaferrea massiliensis]|uniref:outer membrane protein assembly factor BamB family protein n=1 Tax=Candidatus Soleaferrea massiliensis TaxID=1470354 RepID=UPI0018CFD1FB|nr:PQQ-binding-like beta-propeller repeat protein [Candidatus Soleaferrea massiliensis]